MVWSPVENKPTRVKLAESIIAISVLIIVASVVIGFLSPLFCCSLPALIPLLWAGYVYYKNEEQKREREKNKPRLPPEQMV
jgi:flagellar basal body-associated protein FliL